MSDRDETADLMTGIGLMHWLLREDEINVDELAGQDHVAAISGSMLLCHLLLQSLSVSLDKSPKEVLELITRIATSVADEPGAHGDCPKD